MHAKDDQTRTRREQIRVVLLSSLGGALEFYDFIIFGTFAAYLSRVFFPSGDSLVSLLFTFAVFGAGYLARPIGGLVFGSRGDIHGRRHSFLVSLAVMSVTTVAIGFLPTYESAGAAASVAFVLCRLIQGFCLGGELPGAITYAVESVKPNHAGLACGAVFACVTAGVLLATGVNLGLHRVLTEAEMLSYGWRIAFLIGGGLGAVSWLLRRSLAESPVYLAMRTKGTLVSENQRGPLATLLRSHPRRVIVAIGATGVVAAFNGLLFGHMPAYLVRTVGYSGAEVALALNIASATSAIALFLGSWLSDFARRRVLFQIGCLVIALGAIPVYRIIADRQLPLTTTFVLIGLSSAFTHGTFAVLLADIFPARIRFSGVAVALNVGAVVFSGLGPLIATWLIAATGQPSAPGYYICFAAVLALLVSFRLRGLEGQMSLGDGLTDQTDRIARIVPQARPMGETI